MTTFNNTTTPAFKLNASNNVTAQPKHPLKVANNAPRKTTEDTFVKTKEPKLAVASAAVTTKQGNQWLLPVAGSMAGVLLAIGTFFVGKKQAEKETLKIISDTTGKTGDTAEKLAEALKKEMNQSSSSIQQFSDKAISLLQNLLPSEHQNKTGDDLITAVQAHVKDLGREAKTYKKEIDDAERLLKKLLIDSNLAADADLKDKNYAQLLKLEETTMIDLQKQQAPPPSPVESAVETLYSSLVTGGTETDPVKMLEAITTHHDKLDEAKVKSLKQALTEVNVNFADDADFGSLLELAKVEMQKPAPSRIPEDEAKLTALAKLTTTIEQAYQKTGDTTATNIEDKLTFLQKQAEEQVALLETKTDTIKQLEKLSKELATQLYTIHAEKTNTVGEQIVALLDAPTEEPPTGLKKLLSEDVVESQNWTTPFTMDDIIKVLSNGFEVRSDEKEKTFAVRTYLIQHLLKPENYKELKPLERQLLTEYFEALVKHPGVEVSAELKLGVLQIPRTFEADTQFLQTAFEAVGKNPNLDALFEHPLLDGFTTSENEALILPHLQEALSQLHSNPAQFNPKDQMTVPELIVKRALELATKESTLTDFQEIKNLVSDTNLYPDGVKMTQKQALATVINNLNAKLGGGGTTNTALLYQASPQDSGSALSPLFEILESVKRVADLSMDSPDRLVQKDFQNKIEIPLIKHFAKLHFPKDYEADKEAGKGNTITSLGLLRIMEEATKNLDNTDPRKESLPKALANLREFHEHITSIGKLSASTTKIITNEDQQRLQAKLEGVGLTSPTDYMAFLRQPMLCYALAQNSVDVDMVKNCATLLHSQIVSTCWVRGNQSEEGINVSGKSWQNLSQQSNYFIGIFRQEEAMQKEVVDQLPKKVQDMGKELAGKKDKEQAKYYLEEVVPYLQTVYRKLENPFS